MASLGRLASIGRYGCNCQQGSRLSRQQIIQLRYLSSPKTTEITAETQSSKRKQRRDPNAVLRALASTVKPVNTQPPYGFFDDAILMPRTLLRKQEYQKARESGRQAALYVLKNYPDLTRLREPDPDWRENREVFEEKEDEETLNYHINNSRLKETVQLYEKLRDNGTDLSLATLNRVLDLVGYHGIGNELQRVRRIPPREEDEEQAEENTPESSSSSSSSDSSDSSSDEDGDGSKQEATSVARTTVDSTKERSIWRTDNYAETMFAEMEEKNGATYEALILSLLKFDETDRAFKIYESMLEQGLQGSTFLYNTLVSALSKMVLPNNEKWSRVKNLLGNMTKEPVVQPDIGTFNNLLELSYVMGARAPQIASQIINEMLAIGVEPSLSSYLFVLKINTSRGIYTPKLMGSIIERIKDQKLSIQHERDYDFFNVAMATAKDHNDPQSAKELHDLAHMPGNHRFWASKSRVFLGNYLNAIAAADKDTEFVFKEYDRLVPDMVYLRAWSYEVFFDRIASENEAWRIPRLYQDIKTSGVFLGVVLIKKIFRAMSTDISQQDAKPILEVAEDLWNTVENTDLEAKPMLLDQMIRLYALNSKFSSARQLIETSMENQLTPSNKAMENLLKICAGERDIEEVMAIVELMSKLHQKLRADQLESLIQELELSENQREYIRSLVE